MAHELEILEDGSASMAWAGNQVPWHGLGTRVDENISSTEMLKAAKLDWRVEECETFADYNGEMISTGMKALVRDSDKKVLTQVGPKWNPVQNQEAFDFFTEFVEQGDMKMHTAGSLKGGRIVWALAKVEDHFEVTPGDRVDSYLLFTNPHIYGKVVDVRFTPIRVVCNNTLTLSLSTKSTAQVKLNHSREFDPERVKELMGIAKIKLGKYKEMADHLSSKRTTQETVKKYFGELLGTSEKDGTLSRNAERAMEVMHTQPGAEFSEGTWWQPFNAITYLADHKLGRENETRMESAWYGNNAKLKTKALELALEYAK